MAGRKDVVRSSLGGWACGASVLADVDVDEAVEGVSVSVEPYGWRRRPPMAEWAAALRRRRGSERSVSAHADEKRADVRPHRSCCKH